MPTARITQLTIYPVKSMRGVDLPAARLTREGLAHDRRFMVVREDGRFVSQRELPALALTDALIEDGRLILRRRDYGEISFPLDGNEGQKATVRIWRDECEATDTGGKVSAWLTRTLSSAEPLRLVRMAAGFSRPQSQPERLGAETHTFFADAAPFLVTNTASLDRLNHELEARGEQPVPMNRFRPNVVLDGPEPFSEHRLDEAVAAGYSLKFRHPCQRCVITTIDQANAHKHAGWQPYKTLCEINPDPDNPRAPLFGQNATLEKGDGQEISVGDELLLTRR